MYGGAILVHVFKPPPLGVFVFEIRDPNPGLVVLKENRPGKPAMWPVSLFWEGSGNPGLTKPWLSLIA